MSEDFDLNAWRRLLRVSAAVKAKRNAKAKRHKIRLKRLSAPITPVRIAKFTKHLLVVSFAPGEECWVYTSFKKPATLDDLLYRTNTYTSVTFNQEQVGPHKFAYAAAHGITIAQLDGFDIHHIDGCFGYRCSNPDHLQKVPSPPHRGSGGKPRTLNPRHVRMVKTILEAAPADRRPEDQRGVSHAGRRRRMLAGIPFLAKLGQISGMIDVDSDSANTTQS